MADLLPVDTTSPAVAALTPPIARLDVPLAQLDADLQQLRSKREAAERQARYLRVEAEHAAEAGLTVDDYRRRCRLSDYGHLLHDADADASTNPFPCLSKGVSARYIDGGQR